MKFHLCDTVLGCVGLVVSTRGLRVATLPHLTRDEALREVTELGALEPASAADLLSTFDENIASAPTLLLNRSDGELNQSSTLKRGHRTSSRFRESSCCGTSS